MPEEVIDLVGDVEFVIDLLNGHLDWRRNIKLLDVLPEVARAVDGLEVRRSSQGKFSALEDAPAWKSFTVEG